MRNILLRAIGKGGRVQIMNVLLKHLTVVKPKPGTPAWDRHLSGELKRLRHLRTLPY